ncbi:UNVERIFIED_CONTAM: poly-beta-1,6-N-acetyl-D-glucosamine N-deacetylase PgaB [Acinetobacter baumannii]|uniref:poly-beta-1,6-N-acetyl-D-glucosamine N-deacetylase PgaB n=1 Tax=Acinetobacter baumannii TaxID=470 RepID=UPI0025A13BB9|nr:poly-beta-1,6-N-acetyl-D-glucosamine N-deacetylase PgaB [Acinetobacter baumannii]MCZ3029049.1 poly-beta-1,6-N-acetyl-D-glucosamine N-deacetylase PgaB [Acinetobacter baumannii]MDQ8868345.1 poly-beta-1,6-N-acetyl-D-glucosamine N-deacetylase PgaB [Acinetobacter baumannii]MDQ9836746.1 poly-beta-1,6-N-acetyl-D-glucosamine N-deacetylase PgaB [Acinetobacter baumannii]MDQ9953261.1 poly-beta-1,6-N-acetyl-D-glucosamine N-deacetylase PgaB [Acinetobacter baumannii]HEE6601682.1 poly-beta-1,6-N-acetyl-D-
MITRFASPLLNLTLGLALAGLSGMALANPPKIDASTLTVIGYHEITDTKNALIPQYAVTTQQFTEHVDWLQKNGFHFITVDQLIRAHQGKAALPTKPVLLTVDDGYQSFYQNAYPVIKAKKIPVVLAVVGSWLEPKAGQKVDFSGEEIPRDKILSWGELKEMQDSGFVEIASHSYHLHRGITGNPQENSEPAATTRFYDVKTKTYENDSQYQARIYNDLKKNNQLLKEHGIRSPRIMVWPYGRYNMQTVQIAKKLGMPITITLDDGADHAKQSLQNMSRILVEGGMSTNDLAQEIKNRELNLTDNNRPQKIMHIDLDYIYDPDPQQQERNLGHLLDRINAMGVNTVYLQAFSDPDANGSADMVYFPNRHIPMRADLFNRVAWQIQTRTPVSRIYAWMPLLAWELPKTDPVSKDLVVTEQAKAGEHLNMGYIRLSPFSPQARQTIREIYQDLAKSASFNGILFHDDVTLSDYEDASPDALKAYAKQGLPTDLAKIRENDQDLQKWTAYKTKYLDDFAMQLVEDVRQYEPFLLTARNLYAQVALKPYAENWYSQSLEESLRRYDFTAIMAMPYMEQVDNADQFYKDMIDRVKKYPNGIKKTVFELQATNWRNNEKVPSTEMAATIHSLYQQGAMHVAYYPDDPIKDHPDVNVMHKAFAEKSSRLVP